MTKWIKGFRVNENYVIAIIGVALAALLRLSVREYQLDNFPDYLDWYKVVKTHGFGVIRTEFYDYTPAYLYALFLISRALPRISPVFATKIPTIAADFVCAWYACRLLRLQYKVGPVPIFAALAVLFAPTVIMNGAVWGETDMLFTAPLVVALYYIVRQKERAAWLAIGIAFCIKPQTIFIAPFLLALLLRRELSWRNVVWAPIVFLVSILPAWVAGRPIYDLLTIYYTQGAIQATKLTWRAPNLYTWLPQGRVSFFSPAGILFGVAIGFIFVAVAWRSRVRATPQLLTGLALASVLIMPYVLPGMHERYFFTADVFAILLAFYVPAHIYLALLIGMVSFFAYQPFLFHFEVVPMPLLALALLPGLVVLVRWLLSALYPEEAIRAASSE